MLLLVLSVLCHRCAHCTAVYMHSARTTRLSGRQSQLTAESAVSFHDVTFPTENSTSSGGMKHIAFAGDPHSVGPGDDNITPSDPHSIGPGDDTITLSDPHSIGPGDDTITLSDPHSVGPGDDTITLSDPHSIGPGDDTITLSDPHSIGPGDDTITLSDPHSIGPGDDTTTLSDPHSVGPGDDTITLSDPHSIGPGDDTTTLSDSHSVGPGDDITASGLYSIGDHEDDTKTSASATDHTRHSMLSSYAGQTTTKSTLRNDSLKASFEDSVLIDTASMNRCLENSEKQQHHALTLEIVAEYDHTAARKKGAKAKRSKLKCNIELVVPEDMEVKVQVANFSCPKGGSRRLHVLESRSLDTLVLVSSSASVAGEFSRSNRVMAKITADSAFYLHLILTAVPPENELQINYTGPVKGYVQTPRWDGALHYPHSMNSRRLIVVPAPHNIMLSFYSLRLGEPRECPEDYLKIFMARARSKGSKIYNDQPLPKLCGVTVPPDPSIYSATRVLFVFVSNTRTQHTGFRTLFSFHNDSSRPNKLSTGQWNCSVSYWPEFQHHFPCNLQSDCVNSEDEVDCPYVTAACGAGAISTGEGCYVLVNAKQKKRSFRELNRVCETRGGRMASLNTEQEWERLWHTLIAKRGHWERVIIGLQPAPSTWPAMYRNSFQWADGSVAFYNKLFNIPARDMCAFFIESWERSELGGADCNPIFTDKHIVCELDRPQDNVTTPSLHIPLPQPTSRPKIRLDPCPGGHLTHPFLACHGVHDCLDGSNPCRESSSQPPSPLFACANNIDFVPYTLVCDHRHDCPDGTDEHFCVFLPCWDKNDFQCQNGQCIAEDKLCDGRDHCIDNSYQQKCILEHRKMTESEPPPLIVDMDQSGKLTVTSVSPSYFPNGTVCCPETHFQCASVHNYYCLPVYLRCNGVYDCRDREDELNCLSYKCAGFYRCRSSKICVHPDHVCDGHFQCPQHDDELLCDLQCPDGCTCWGLAFICTAPFRPPQLRYLDATGSMLTFSHLRNNTMLVHLILVKCNLTHVPDLGFPNLRYLDLSHNSIRSFNGSHLRGSPNMKILILSKNPLSELYASHVQASFSVLLTLDLSHTRLHVFDVANLTMFRELQILNISASGVDQIIGKGFQLLSSLRVLDLRGCPLTLFPRGIMADLEELRSVFSDNYKLCCPATLPAGFDLSKCHAPSDEISSCDTLLRSDFFRMFLYVFAFMSLIGNAGGFIYRFIINKTKTTYSFSIFVTQLCISDFLMGVYLTIIGTADRQYQGAYLWEDVRWRNSAVCKAAGFLSLLSCELSAFIICLITLDRFLVLQFPFSQVHFRRNSARVACLAVWITGLLIALFPLLPFNSHWQFYQQSSICIPLPVTRQYFDGLFYSFGVIVVLNSVLFLLIAFGQACIYQAIKANSIPLDDSSKSSMKEVTIARRLITIAVSDFLCWFPIGVLGLLVSQDVPIPGEVNVGMAIFVLPINSALNPFLYTLNVIREKRRQDQFKRLQALFQSRMLAKEQQKRCRWPSQRRAVYRQDRSVPPDDNS